MLSSKYTLILNRIPILHVDLVLHWYTSHLTFFMGVQGLSLFEIHMREMGPCFYLYLLLPAGLYLLCLSIRKIVALKSVSCEMLKHT